MPGAAEKRRAAVVEKVAAILDRGEPTRFAYEGACRHGVRVGFILGAGWPWQAADAAAAEIIEAAFHRLGVSRPRWAEGQPEHVEPAVARFFCARCGVELPESLGDKPRTYCSRACAHAARMFRHRQDNEAENRAYQEAWRKAWQARQPERTCRGCGESFRPKAPSSGGKFCSMACYSRARARAKG